MSDWNGKSLNCTFGSSLEIDPMNIPGAKDLKDFYHSLSSNRDQFQSLTSNDRSAGMRPQSQQSDSFVTLKQIHDDFKDASNNHTTSKYYNVCAYVTSKFGTHRGPINFKNPRQKTREISRNFISIFSIRIKSFQKMKHTIPKKSVKLIHFI